jgi:hemerythrin
VSNFFEWDQAKFGLGIAPMDDEHKAIIASMNKLHELKDASAQKSALSRALNELQSVTVKHFSDEEAFMGKIGFPDLSKHKLIHKSLLDQIVGHKATFESTGQLTEEFFDFLKFWLKSHICGIDMRYSQYHKSH